MQFYWWVLVIAACLAGLVMILRVRRDRMLALHRQIFNRLALPDVSGDVFEPKQTVLLPPPASRYLRHAIEPGAPLARTVDLHMIGEIRASESGDWFNFEAAQRICPERGFLWQARIEALGRLFAEGADYYCDGFAGSDFFIAGPWPLSHVKGGEFSRSAAGRLIIESIWLPTSLVAARGAEWTSGDQHRVTVRLPGQAESSSLNMTVAESGALVDVTMMRHLGGEGRSFGLMPYGLRVEAEKRFAEYTIPSRVSAVWGYGTDAAEEYLRIQIENARFL